MAKLDDQSESTEVGVLEESSVPFLVGSLSPTAALKFLRRNLPSQYGVEAVYVVGPYNHDRGSRLPSNRYIEVRG